MSTDGSGGWYESPDGVHGGIGLEWAFHMNEKDIIDAAPHAFVDHLLNAVTQGIEEEFDEEQWESILSEYR